MVIVKLIAYIGYFLNYNDMKCPDFLNSFFPRKIFEKSFNLKSIFGPSPGTKPFLSYK